MLLHLQNVAVVLGLGVPQPFCPLLLKCLHLSVNIVLSLLLHLVPVLLHFLNLCVHKLVGDLLHLLQAFEIRIIDLDLLMNFFVPLLKFLDIEVLAVFHLLEGQLGS